MIRTLMTVAALAVAVVPVGAAQVSFYPLPPNAYPHDVAPGPHGLVWYSGQQLGVLGVFDPVSGKAEHVALGSGSSPHGVIQAPDGAAWLTDGGQNAMVRFDPTSKAIRVFPLPANFPRANLNTAVVDKAGLVWFTGQGGVHGRVDPKSGKVDAWASPRGRGPYGITVTPAGEVWYASLAGDHIAHVDRASGEATIVEPPRKGVGPRRIWSDSKGLLWVSFWNAGGVGRYDPDRKVWTHYPMPQSKGGTYSVYVDDKDRVWATDWHANAIQRFDPVTESFATFPSDKRSANIRQMLGRPGEAWGGESGTNRLVVVRD
jgi:virginiamycin B lyase